MSHASSFKKEANKYSETLLRREGLHLLARRRTEQDAREVAPRVGSWVGAAALGTLCDCLTWAELSKD